MNAALETLLVREGRRLQTPLWWVGGPVRDEILKRPWLDGDLACTNALRVAQRLRRVLAAKLITLDDQYRIYRIILPTGGATLDIAELQGKTIEADLARRDFSINAMARRVGHPEVLDPWNGRGDIRRKKIRALAKKTLEDDPIRRLRAFRFSAQLGFAIVPQTLRWIRQGTLRGVAAERIREELLKLMASLQSGSVLAAMDESGLLVGIFEELEACRRTAPAYYGKGGVLKHSLATVRNLEWLLAHRPVFTPAQWAECARYLDEPVGGFPRRAWLKLGALLHDIGKPATAQKIDGRLRFFGHEEVGADMVGPLAQRLRLSRQETQLIRQWVKQHMRLGGLAVASGAGVKAFARYFRDLDGRDGLGMILVSLADHYDYLSPKRWGKNTDPVEKTAKRMMDAYFSERSRLRPARLINGHDVMKALRLPPSPEIGRILERVQDAQVEGKVTTRTEALAFLKRTVGSSPKRGPSRSA